MWMFGHMQAYVCISGCVYTCNWLSVVFVCAHACACVCMYVHLLRPQQETHLPARGTIRGTVRRRWDYSEAVASRLHSATRKVCEKKRRTQSPTISLLPACVISSLATSSSVSLMVLLSFFVIQGS